ncbi:hypothetical protein SBA6_1320007 [Candidatus Sulfopaludibacter sp. SbA6]|nr:hypothetical protein SBA6_1320007 [Candidatus Sulfopaludibacter sp. SbA6]
MGRFERELRFRDHRFLIQVDQLARRLGNGVLLADARLNRNVRGFVIVARFRGGEFLLVDPGPLLAPEVGGQFEIHAELPHGRHAALVEIAAGERVVGVVVPARQVGRQLIALDHLLFADDRGGLCSGVGQHLVERGGDFPRRHFHRHFDVSHPRAVQERADFDFLGGPLLLVAEELRLEDRELRLRLENILLRGPAHGVAGFGNAQDILQQVLVAVDEDDAHVGVVQLVVGLLEPRDHAESHRAILLEFGIGLFDGDLAAQLELAGERHFLRDGDAGVAGGGGSDSGDWPRAPVGCVAQRDGGVGEARGLAGALARGFVFLLRRQDLAIVAQSFADKLGQGLRTGERRQYGNQNESRAHFLSPSGTTYTSECERKPTRCGVRRGRPVGRVPPALETAQRVR